MTNALLWSNIARMAENCPLFQRFYGTEIKRAPSYNFPECIIHTYLTSIVVNVQLASRPVPFFAGLREGGIPCKRQDSRTAHSQP